MAGYLQQTEGSEPVPGYRLIEYLGGGGLGDVWKASAPGGALVAMKIVNLRRSGTVHEFRALEQIKNIRAPNLVPVFAYWLLDDGGRVISDPVANPLAQPPGRPGPARPGYPSAGPRAAWLIMAMGLGSKSLFQRLQECVAEGQPGIPWNELLDYMEDSARGIDYLNQPPDKRESIIHGDIKPHNILIVGNAAQICDFGLARQVDSIRSTNMPFGTVAYAAPELLQSQALHQNTDQYCLAVTYIELRTGVLPFDADTVVKICERHLKGELDLSGLKPCERAVIARAVALDANQRWPSCREMVRALRRACEADEAAGRLAAEKPGAEIVPGCWLLEPLGKGSLGTTWKARTQDGAQLALKTINFAPQSAVAQVQTLRRLRLLRHERILPILRLWIVTEEGYAYEDRVGDVSGDLALLEPYAAAVARPVTALVGLELASRNLSACCEHHRKGGSTGIPWRELLDYLDDAAEGVDYLHQPGSGLLKPAIPLVHSRIKPQNLVLVGHSLKVADFGLHTVAGREPPSPAEAGPYAPPEAHKGRWLPAGDQFALAVCYVEMRAGRPAVRTSESRTAAVAGQSGPIDLSGLSRGEQERVVVARALAPSPEDRWPSCEEFLRHLRAACEADEKALQRPRRGAEAPGSEILPGYHLVEKLGQGQIGRVWKATARGGMLRALKIVDLRGRAGLKELEALEQVKGIRSGNLVSISSYWLIDRDGFILSDSLKGLAPVSARTGKPSARDSATFPAAELIIEMDLASKTLFHRLKECQRERKPGIPTDELLRYMEQAAAGIDYLNRPDERPDTLQVEIVHGDIKPQNIMIVGNTAAVGDFGLARVVQRLGVQQTGMGTCAYAAPELLKGQPHRTSDQYCLAMSYVELRVGRLPFEDADPMAIARKHWEGNLELESLGLPPGELAVIRKATSLAPRDRYASCTEMVRALRRAIEEREAPKAPAVASAPPPVSAPVGPMPLPPVQTPPLRDAAATIVPPSEETRDDARRTPSGGSAYETLPVAEPPAGSVREAQPLAEPAVADDRSRVGPPRPYRRWLVAALVLVPIVVLAAALLAGSGLPQRLASGFNQWWQGGGSAKEKGKEKQDPNGKEKEKPKEDEGKAQEEKNAKEKGQDKGREKPKGKDHSRTPDPAGELLKQIQERIAADKHDEVRDLLAKRRSELGPSRMESVRQSWLTKAQSLWKEDPASTNLRDACAGIVAIFPECGEARVLRVRALLRRHDYAQAAASLKEDPPNSWPAGSENLRRALTLISGALGGGDVAPEKLKEALDALARIDWPATPDPRWQLDDVEKSKIDEIHAIAGRGWMEQQRSALRGGLKVAREHVQAKRYAEAGKPLASARSALENMRAPPAGAVPPGAKPDVDREHRNEILDLDYLGAVVSLHLAATTPAEVARAMATADRLLAESSRLSPEQTRGLCLALGEVRRLGDRDQIARAIRLVHGACERSPGRSELAVPLGALWEKRIALDVSQREPGAADFEEFQKDWALWRNVLPQDKAEVTVDEALVGAWRTECLLATGKEADAQLPDLAGLAEAFKPYGQYVAARVHAHAGRPDDALAALGAVFAESGVPEVVAKAQGRRLERAVESLVAAIGAARKLRPAKSRLDPYADAKEASRDFQLASTARSAAGDRLPQDLRTRLEIVLALAARGKSDDKTAASVSAGLVKLPREQLGPDRLVVLHAFLASHVPADQQPPTLPAAERETILQATIDALDLLRGAALSKEEANTLYRTVLYPVYAAAAASRAPGDAKFCAAVGRFLWTRHDDDWPVNHELVLDFVEQAFTAAIESSKDASAAGKERAEYFLRRGQSRLARKSPNMEAVGDADDAVRLDGGNHEIRGLHAEAYLRRSRTQDLRKQRIVDLDTAIDSGDRAEKTARGVADADRAESARALPKYLLTLSMAHLERVNFERAGRNEHLDKAVQCAVAAKDLLAGRADADSPYMPLGNAYEDLAWALDKEPERYYREAIDAFTKARQARQLVAADAARSIGRCYYRAAVDSCLDRLGSMDRTAMLKEAESQLSEVVTDLDRTDPEAHYFLGMVYWSQDPPNFARATQCFESAKKLSESRPEHAYYLQQWAIFPMYDPGAISTATATVSDRLKDLAKAPVPPGGAIHPEREAIRMGARLLQRDGKWDEAIRECQRALAAVPEPDWAEVNLLLDLTECRLRLAYDQARKSPRNADNTRDFSAARATVAESLKSAQLAERAAVTRRQEADSNRLIADAYGALWMYTTEEESWKKAVDAFDRVVELQPRRRIAQEALAKKANLYLAHAGRVKPPTFQALSDYAEAIKWQKTAAESVRPVPGETAADVQTAKNRLRERLAAQFAKPALDAAGEVGKTDSTNAAQISAWIAEWKNL